MKTQSFNIILPKDLVVKIDALAKKEYRNRSELIREAVRVYINNAEDWGDIFRAGQQAAKKLGIKSEEEIDKIVYEFRHGKRTS